MTWTPEHSIALISIVVAVFWQTSKSSSRKTREYYETNRKRIYCAPPGWLFGIAWTIIYCLVVASTFLVFQPGSTYTYGYQTIIAWLINILLNKYWSNLFFDTHRIGLALIVAVGLVATGGVVLGFMGADNANVGWVPFALYFVYPVWCTFALILNFQWWTASMAEQHQTTVGVPSMAAVDHKGSGFRWPAPTTNKKPNYHIRRV